MLYKLLELRFWPGSLWASLYNHVEMRDGSTKCASCPFFSTQADISSLAIAASLLASEVIADSISTPKSARPALQYS